MKKKLILTLLTAFICATTAIKATSLAMEKNIIEIETNGVNKEIKTNLENVKNSMKENIDILKFLVKTFENSSLKDKTYILIPMCNQVLEMLDDNLLNSVENYNKNTCEILQKIKESFENFKKDIENSKDLKNTINNKIKEFSKLVDQISLDSHAQEENAPLANEKKVNEDNKNEDNKNNNYKTDVVTNIYNDNDNGISPAPLLQGTIKTPQNSNNNNNNIINYDNINNENKIEELKADNIEDKKIEELKADNVNNENKIEEQPQANNIEKYINYNNMSKTQKEKMLKKQWLRIKQSKKQHKTQKLKTNNIINENKIKELKANNIINENEIKEPKIRNINNDDKIKEPKIRNINNDDKIKELKANNIINENEIKEPEVNNINNENKIEKLKANDINNDNNKNVIIENYIENPKISKVNNDNTKKTTLSKGNKNRKRRKQNQLRNKIVESNEKEEKKDDIIPTKIIINYIKDVLNFNRKIETYVIDYLVFSHNNDIERFSDEKYLKTKMNEILNIIKTFSNRILNPEKELSNIKKFLNIKEIQKIFSDTELIISNNIKKIKSSNLFNYEDSELLKEVTIYIDNLEKKIDQKISKLINKNLIVDNNEDFKNFKNNVNLFLNLKYEINIGYTEILAKFQKLEIDEDEFIKRTNDFLNEKFLYFHNQEKSKELSTINKKLLDINDFCKNNIENSKKSFDSKGVKKISNDVKTISHLPKPLNAMLTDPIDSIINWETVLAKRLCTYEF